MNNNSEFIGLTFSEIIFVMFFLLIVLLPYMNLECPEPQPCPKPEPCPLCPPCPEPLTPCCPCDSIIFELKETEGYIFEKSKADISSFKDKLLKEIPKIKGKFNELNSKYGIDTIEIIGHTDFTPVISKSNLDNLIIDVIAKKQNASKLRFGSNADLGLTRALNVGLFLKNEINNANIKVYSAAQLIDPTGQMITRELKLNQGNEDNDAKKNDDKKRRIEIRFTKSKQMNLE